MEQEQEVNPKISVGKQIWVKYFKLIAGFIVISLVALGYFFYSRVKKDTLASVPVDVPYPPTTVTITPAQKSAFADWTKSRGSTIISTLGEELDDFWIDIVVIQSSVEELAASTDSQLIWTNNAYNRKYGVGTGRTLLRDLKGIKVYFSLTFDRSVFALVKRLETIGAK